MPAEPLFLLPNPDSLVSWRDKLKDGLGLVSAGTGDDTFSYCDSFDWRLYSAGLLLEYRSGSHEHGLRLLNIADMTAVAEQRVETGNLRFSGDLPPGEIKNTIVPLLEMRAFLPLAELQVRSHCLHQDDTEGKILVRLFVESYAVRTPAGGSRVLQKCLRLQPLRGYEKAADRIMNKLEKRYKLARGDGQLFQQTCEIIGRQPGDYSSKLTTRLQAEMRADQAVRQVLLELFTAMQINERGTIEDLDSEFLHDFRVAVRRTRSALGELKPVFPPATLKRFRAEFAWLGGLTSDVRDLDVYLLKFGRYQAALPESLRVGLDPLRTFLQYKQRTAHAQLAAELKGAHYRKLKAQWQRYLDTPLAKRPTAAAAAKTIGELADRRTWRMYKRVMREGRAITDESAPPELHEVRKSCKKLRYLMEFFQSLYEKKVIRGLIRELKQLQDNLGDFQDLDVQIRAMQRFALEMRRRGEYSAATGQSMDALLETLKQEMAAVRADFHSRFERFAQQDTQLNFKRLFNSDRARVTA